MALRHTGYFELPAHISLEKGFDHADVSLENGLLYLAHTANDAVDVLDVRQNCYLHSIPQLTGVAGILVCDEQSLLFTSNRGERTVSIISTCDEQCFQKIKVGEKPNGLAYDPLHHLLLCGNVGDPQNPDSHTITMIDVKNQQVIFTIPVEGRTRWSVYDTQSDSFYVNISSPPQIIVIKSSEPDRINQVIAIPCEGPHGLGLDSKRERLFCACDQKAVIVSDLHNGAVIGRIDIHGVPDVVMYNEELQRLYVAIGDPGLIDVIDTQAMEILETVTTEKGAQTMALDSSTHRVYAFLPETHRTMVFEDEAVPPSGMLHVVRVRQDKA